MSGNVTIKAGTGYDVPWIVVEAPTDGSAASQVEAQRSYILAAFGMDPQDPEIVGLSLADVVAQASVHFQGVWSKANGGSANLGAKTGGRKGTTKSQTVQAAAAAQEPQAPVSEPATPPATEAKAPETQAASEPQETVAEYNERVTTPTPEAVAEQLGAEIIEDKVVHPHQEVLDEIAAAKTKKELQAIFHGNKEAMQGDVLEALQARVKAL